MKTLATILMLSLFFALAPKAEAAPTLVQSKSGSGNAGNPTTITLDSTTTAGNTLVIMLNNYYSMTAYSIVFAVSDSNTNTWATSTVVDNYPSTVVGYAPITTGGASHQVTVDVPAGGGGAYYIFTVLEYSGLVSSNVLDQTAGQFQSSGSAYDSTATAATSQADELLIGYNAELSTTMTFTPDAPWADILTFDGTFHTSHIQTRTVAATGTYSSTGNMSSASTNHSHVIATFKATAAGGGGGSTPPMDDGNWFMLFE